MAEPRKFHSASGKIVLVGAGLGNLLTLARLSKDTNPPFRATLINSKSQITYPGKLAELLSHDVGIADATVDLGHLCLAAKADFVQGEIDRLDLEKRKVYAKGLGHGHSYDALSVDLAPEFDIPETISQPMANRLVASFDGAELEEGLTELESVLVEKSKKSVAQIILFGPVLPTLELALSILRRLSLNTGVKRAVKLTLISTTSPTPSLHPREQKLVNTILATSKIEWIQGVTPTAYKRKQKSLSLSNGKSIDCEGLIWLQGQTAPSWLSDFSFDDRGKIEVQTNFECRTRPGVYIHNELTNVARRYPLTLVGHGPDDGRETLVNNLFRRFKGLTQEDYRAPVRLSLVVQSGHERAVKLNGYFSSSAKSVYRKRRASDDKILLSLRPFNPPQMVSTYLESGSSWVLPYGGVSARLPSRVQFNGEPFATQSTLEEDRDCAWLTGDGLDPNLAYAQARVSDLGSDPFTLGRLSAQHCLNKMIALGTNPVSAFAQIAINYDHKMVILKKAREVFEGLKHQCLKSGVNLETYSAHGNCDTNITVSCIGRATGTSCWTAGPVETGDNIILSGPLGNGFITTGFRGFGISTELFQECLGSLLVPRLGILAVATRHGVRSTAHVGSYGLSHSLAERVNPSGLVADLSLANIPIFKGTIDSIKLGVRSTLHVQNRMPFNKALYGLDNRSLHLCELLFDPQLVGAIVLFSKPDKTKALVQDLREQGFEQANVIGEVAERRKSDLTPLRLRYS